MDSGTLHAVRSSAFKRYPLTVAFCRPWRSGWFGDVTAANLPDSPRACSQRRRPRTTLLLKNVIERMQSEWLSGQYRAANSMIVWPHRLRCQKMPVRTGNAYVTTGLRYHSGSAPMGKGLREWWHKDGSAR